MHIIRKSGFNLLILVFLTALSKSIAFAGDYASRDVIGFSADGKYFAFEQYGVQDGSGFPYSEIFIIDTDDDSWVTGSPVKALIEDESRGVDVARKRAKRQAEPLLKRHRISEPGEHLASNPRSEISADPHEIAIDSNYQMTPPSRQLVRISISEKSLPSGCKGFADEPIKGFTLTMRQEGQKRTVLHQDKRVPESRGCALGYSFADIYRHVSGGAQVYAILLHMEKIGFEGPDSRFLAVTTRLP
jgi:predicted secreted protein